MANTTKTKVTISLPSAMINEMERMRKVEYRTRSELVREALRSYFITKQIPEEEATPEEIRAIRRGRAAIARGNFVTLDELLAKYAMARPRKRSSRKVS